MLFSRYTYIFLHISHCFICRSMYSSIPVTVHFQIIITEFFCWTDSAFLSAISIWYAGKSTVFYHCDSILRIKPIKLSLPRFIVLIRFFCPPYLNAHKIRILTRVCVQCHRFCLSSCFRKNHRGFKLSFLPHNPRFTFSHFRHRPFVLRSCKNPPAYGSPLGISYRRSCC